MSNKTGNDLFIVDNSDDEWKVLSYLSEWSEISSRFDIATRTAAETLSALGRDTLLQTDPERIRAFL